LHSAVWKYFEIKPEDDKQCEVYCKVFFSLVAEPQGNTTNLFNHLKHHHQVQHDETIQSKKQRQTSITETLYNATSYPPNSSIHKEITAAITYHLAKDMAPINTAQH